MTDDNRADVRHIIELALVNAILNEASSAISLGSRRKAKRITSDGARLLFRHRTVHGSRFSLEDYTRGLFFHPSKRKYCDESDDRR